MSNQELLDEFVEEAREHLRVMDQELLAWERGERCDGSVDRLFRAVHSIKGVSGFLDLRVIGQLAHALENIFAAIRSNEYEPTSHCIDLLLQASQQLLALVEDVTHSNQKNMSPLIQQLETALTNQVSAEIARSLTQSIHLSSPKHPRIAFSVDAYTLNHALYPYLYQVQITQEDLHKNQRSPVNIVQDLLRVSMILDGQLIVEGESDLRKGLPGPVEVHLLVASDLVVDMLAGFCDLPPERLTLLVGNGEAPTSARPSTNALEKKADEHCPPSSADTQAPKSEVYELPPSAGNSLPEKNPGEVKSNESDSSNKPRSTAIKVDGARLDQLIDLIGELVIAETMVCRAPAVTEARDPVLAKRVTQLDKIVRELQELGTGLRMVPVAPLFSRMERLVRDVAKKLDKPIRLILEGEETELDKNVVERLADPLVHMLRNACDHGIEDRAARAAANKPEQGCVYLRASHTGGSIQIEVEDDGRGLDRERLLKKARSLNILAPEQSLDDHSVWNLIWHPGFSTAEKLSDVSGRGVGMDVVKRNIEDLRGSVTIDNHPGQGCRFIINLPLTMAIIDGMVLRVGNSRFIMPITAMVMTLSPRAEQITQVLGKGELLHVGNEDLPLYRLDQLFAARDNNEHDLVQEVPRQVVVVEHKGRRSALAIDELLNQQQVVIKSLGNLLQGLPGISGGAVLPDGRVGLILDVAGLMPLAESFARGALPFRSDLSTLTGAPAMDSATTERAAEAGKYLAFRLGKERYGIRILAAQEIISLQEITGVPWTPPFIRGVINLRGKVIPIIDLRRRFSLQANPDAERCIMVVQVMVQGEVLIMGIIIDQVPDVVTVAEDHMEPPPPFCAAVDSAFVLGVARVNEHVIMLLDSDRLLSPQECQLLHRAAVAQA